MIQVMSLVQEIYLTPCIILIECVHQLTTFYEILNGFKDSKY